MLHVESLPLAPGVPGCPGDPGVPGWPENKLEKFTSMKYTILRYMYKETQIRYTLFLFCVIYCNVTFRCSHRSLYGFYMY